MLEAAVAEYPERAELRLFLALALRSGGREPEAFRMLGQLVVRRVRPPRLRPGGAVLPRSPRRAVKRHPALVPLSEDHHHELVQARRLLRAADGGADERLGAASAYVESFFTDTVEHFRREEEELFPVYLRHDGADAALVERILREHMELHGLARALRAEVAADDVREQTLRDLGTLLHDHVRLEERELFESIQRLVPGEELDALQRCDK